MSCSLGTGFAGIEAAVVLRIHFKTATLADNLVKFEAYLLVVLNTYKRACV